MGYNVIAFPRAAGVLYPFVISLTDASIMVSVLGPRLFATGRLREAAASERESF